MVVEEDAWNGEDVVRMFTSENDKGRYNMDGHRARIAHLVSWFPNGKPKLPDHLDSDLGNVKYNVK